MRDAEAEAIGGAGHQPNVCQTNLLEIEFATDVGCARDVCAVNGA